MLISLSILPITCLLVHSVTSVDVYKSKRVPRRHTAVIRSHKLDRPPHIENYDFIPVSVTRNDLSAKRGVITGHQNFHHKSVNTFRKLPKSMVQSMRYPASDEDYESIPVAEENILMKPNMRFINTEKGSAKSKHHVRSADTEDNTGNKMHRRRSLVRRVQVDKSQLQSYVNEAEQNDPDEFVHKIAQKGIGRRRTSRSDDDDQFSKSHIGRDNSKKRKQVREPVVPILESENYVFAHSGDFHYSYEGGDGTKAFERGELKSSKGGAGSAVEGSFSYKDKDGNDFSLSYTADENGYRPVGAHLPTPPPIPPAIQRALAILATKTTPESITESVENK